MVSNTFLEVSLKLIMLLKSHEILIQTSVNNPSPSLTLLLHLLKYCYLLSKCSNLGPDTFYVAFLCLLLPMKHQPRGTVSEQVSVPFLNLWTSLVQELGYNSGASRLHSCLVTYNLFASCYMEISCESHWLCSCLPCVDLCLISLSFIVWKCTQ